MANEHRYCGPCGEYYDDGDVLADDSIDPVELLSLTGTECPMCWETGRPVDELAEQQHEDMSASFHDGGSGTWRMIEEARR